MKAPKKEEFILVLTFLQEYCKAPKERVCESCIFHNGEFGVVCLLDMWPEYWDIEQIADRLYGKEV